MQVTLLEELPAFGNWHLSMLQLLQANTDTSVVHMHMVEVQKTRSLLSSLANRRIDVDITGTKVTYRQWQNGYCQV